MNVVIIEDELLTAKDLAECLVQAAPEITVLAILSSVEQAKSYLSGNVSPDLIFADIQLGDGLSFEIFTDVPIKAPIIFCTAYNEYALEAFKANGIDYILKPFTDASIIHTLKKFRALREKMAGQSYLHENMISFLHQRLGQRKNAVLVYQKEKIIPLPVNEIALCYIQNKITLVVCFDERNFIISQSLDELESNCGTGFYRANRQYLVNRLAIKEVSHYYARKLMIKLTLPFKNSITVSKERSTIFLEWLANT